jgi:hypothetical protein
MIVAVAGFNSRLLIAPGFTVRVNVWVALGGTPLLAVKWRVKVPALVVVPLNTPVAALKVSPPGSVSIAFSLRVGVGVPDVVTVNVPNVPAVNVVIPTLVNKGGVPVTVRLALPLLFE